MWMLAAAAAVTALSSSFASVLHFGVVDAIVDGIQRIEAAVLLLRYGDAQSD